MTALDVLKETHAELSADSSTDWKQFDEIMKDGTGEAMLKAMERYAEIKCAQFAKWCMENAGVFPKDKGKIYSINEKPGEAGWSYESLYEEFKKTTE